MANPAKLPVTELVANSMTARPSGDAIDTDGDVPILAADLGGASGRLVIEVTSGIDDLVVTVRHGDNPPAVREALGDHSETLDNGAVGLFGPYEAARFMQDDGRVLVNFNVAGAGAATATVRTYLLPKAV